MEAHAHVEIEIGCVSRREQGGFGEDGRAAASNGRTLRTDGHLIRSGAMAEHGVDVLRLKP
jgi:hypothetical protein